MGIELHSPTSRPGKVGLCGLHHGRFSRRIAGWRHRSSIVLNALEQALCDRKPSEVDGLMGHSDRGSQCLSIRYSEQLAKAGIEPSVGFEGDGYDNALVRPQPSDLNQLASAKPVVVQSPFTGVLDSQVPRKTGAIQETSTQSSSRTSALPGPIDVIVQERCDLQSEPLRREMTLPSLDSTDGCDPEKVRLHHEILTLRCAL